MPAERGEGAYGQLSALGIEAQIGLGQWPEGFGELMGFLGRGDPRVPQDIVHLGNTGGGGIAEPGDLDGGWAPGEEGQAVMGGMSGEVEEDVDALRADEGTGMGVIEGVEGMPSMEQGAQALGDGILFRDGGLGEALELGTV